MDLPEEVFPSPEDDAAGSPGIAGRLMIVVHDARNHGAQQLALHLARTLTERFHLRLEIALLGPGELWSQFEESGRVHDLSTTAVKPIDRQQLLVQLRAEGVGVAFCNSTASGPLVRELARSGYRIVSLVHELPGAISAYGLEEWAQDIADLSDAVLFPSEIVRSGFESMAGTVGSRARIRPQGLYKRPEFALDRDRARLELREMLDLGSETTVALAVGYADHRKGFDLFLDVFERVAAERSDIAFVWLGCEDPDLIELGNAAAARSGREDAIRLLPRVPDVERYYSGSDLLLLPSREDAFPSVILEALSHGVPVVAFEGATGAADLLRNSCGELVPYLDTPAMSAAVLRLVGDPSRRARLGEAGREIVERDYSWLDYVHELLELAELRPSGTAGLPG